MKNNLVLIICFIIFFSAGCKKNIEDGFVSTYDTESAANNAKLKINFASIYRANPTFIVKINDVVASGVISARYPYPGGGFNTSGNNMGDYLSVKNGESTIKFVIPNKGTSTDSVVLYQTSVTLANNGYYTLHVADTAANIKKVLFEENRVLLKDTLPYFKLVNLMPNVPAIDLYFGSTLVASNIAYMASSAEFTVDLSQTTTEWSVRAAGSAFSTTPIAKYTSGSTYIRGRKYTAFAMGYNGITLSTDPRRPFISFFYTR